MRKALPLLLSFILLFASCVFSYGVQGEAQQAADQLYALGLFSGTGTSADGSPIYGLDRTLTRQEAITMILSLLGKTQEARSMASASHFTDVDPWAQPYVEYAFQKGITAGVGPGLFGAHREVSAAEYLTFLLLCLGYEQGTDFQWDESPVRTDWIGITRGEYAGGQSFTRADAVIVSERALHACRKGSDDTLADTLGLVTLDQDLALPAQVASSSWSFDLEDVPAYTGAPFVLLNAGIPEFSEEDLSLLSFERYGNLDALGRCTAAFACLSRDLMPEGERDAIGQIRPTGWHTVRYDDLIEDRYLYNRCHLIAFSLAGENANAKNLITGTRSMNIDGMSGFEARISNYLSHSDNHVLYRATPVFSGNDLLARGVHLEVLSEEDGGEGIMLNVFIYNVQPGIEIDYSTGESRAMENAQEVIANRNAALPDSAYVANTKTGKFHYTWCRAAQTMAERNKYYSDDREELIQFFEPCKICNP